MASETIPCLRLPARPRRTCVGGQGLWPAVGPGLTPGAIQGQPLAQRAALDAQVLDDPTHRCSGVFSYRSTA